MSFKNGSHWNEKNELKSFLILKKLQEENFPRGMQIKLCRQMEKETNLKTGSISAKVSNYKSEAGINNPSESTKQTYLKYKSCSIKELEEIIDTL